MKHTLTAFALMLSTSAFAVPNVLVTTSQLADVTRNVAGAHANVTGMMGPGVDPHLYQATPSDVQHLQNADLIIYHGLHLEGQLGDVLARFAQLRPTAAVAEEAIPHELLIETDESGLTVDPHVWMDAGLFSLTAPVIAAHLGELDPENAADYHANAEHYVEQLRALHTWIGEAIATIPEESRILITAHDAFEYYSAAYGIQVAAIQGLSTESEAGVADIRETADLITELRVPAVFIESTINPRTIQAVLEAVNNRGFAAQLGGELYSDAMGADEEPEGTVIGMLIHNTSTITTALGGELPELPEELDGWVLRWQPE